VYAVRDIQVTKNGPHNQDVHKLFKGNQEHGLETGISTHLTNVQTVTN